MAALTCVQSPSPVLFDENKNAEPKYFGSTKRKLVYEQVYQEKPQSAPICENQEVVKRAVTVEPKEIEVVEEKPKEYKWEIVWQNVFLLGALHILAIYGAYLKFSLYGIYYYNWSVVFGKTLGVLCSLAITAGYHRLWTHQCYKAKLPLEIFLMICGCLTYQNSIYDWARDHRVHHKFSDTDADPHNSQRGFFFSHCGWLMVRKHPDVKTKGKTVDMSDLESNPIVMFQHKYYYFLVFVFALILPVTLPYLAGLSLWHAFCCMTCYKFVVTVNLTWAVNSVAHMFGSRPYDKNIGPSENAFMKMFIFGEGFHNYHHTFPWDYKASEFSNDSRNLTTYFIDFFAKIGWAYDLKEAPKKVIDQRKSRTGTDEGYEGYMNTKSWERTLRNWWHGFLVAAWIIIL